MCHQVNLHRPKDGDLFDLNFIGDSYEANSIQPLANYRLNQDTMYNYINASDLTNILFGIKKWSDFLPEPNREKIRIERTDDYSGVDLL